MKPVKNLRRVATNTDRSVQRLAEIREGAANQPSLLDDKFNEVIEGLNNLSSLLNRKSNEIVQGLFNQSSLINSKLSELLDLQRAIVLQQHAQSEVMVELAKAVAQSNRGVLDQSKLQLPEIDIDAYRRPEVDIRQPISSGDDFQRPRDRSSPDASGASRPKQRRRTT